MIDWITALFPCEHDTQISGGLIASFDVAGELEWKADKRLAVEGSHSSTVQVKSADITGSRIWVSGNPAKFLQGHNLFGSDDLVGLAWLMFQGIVAKLDLHPTDFDRANVRKGVYEVKRVDCTAMIALPCQNDVAAFLRAATPVIRGKHQGPSAYKGETLYIGQHSRRITTKLYNKLQELGKHPLPKEIAYRNELMRYAENKLRVEVTLRAMELKDRGLAFAANWNDQTASTLVAERIQNMKLPEKMNLTKSTIEGLPGRLVSVYRHWENGEDLRAMFTRRTFYRYRAELLKHGIDISISQPAKTKSNVVPMVRYLIAEYRGNEIPDWALGTSAYADPKARKVA